ATSVLPELCPLRMRVRKSAMGSVMLMSCSVTRPYQLALRRPGTSPRMVASRSLVRPRPNFRYTPRGRPVIAQRLRWRDGDASRGSACSLARASSRSASVDFGLRMVSFSCTRFAAYRFARASRRFSRSIMLVFAMCRSLLAEREVEGFEQRPPFPVIACGGGDHDVHAPDRVDLVVGDLGEDDLFLDAEAVVAAAVERARRHAAEVADARHRHVDQAVEELVHA